ncbi:hypothetical protein [Nocardia lijiangensis]|uniref:hypothetical protein n=1 Tax=Nocardia lijiangensis TaxID=299618 RepID=UPI000833D0B7|nr:hypothetical protein [Nocardia lijiangensis]
MATAVQIMWDSWRLGLPDRWRGRAGYDSRGGGRTSEWMRARRGTIYEAGASPWHVELIAALIRAVIAP